MKKFKKLVASLLAVLMVLSLAPVTALADGIDLHPIHATRPAEEPAIEQEEEPAEAEIGIIDLEGAEGSDDESYDTQATSSGVTTVIACSDFQYPGGDEGGKQIVRGILTAMKDSGIETADGFLCAGDYWYDYSENAATLKGHIDALKNTVEDIYGTNMHEVYVQGNHDKVTPGEAGLAESGAHDDDADAYGVYVINEDDYMWHNNAAYSDTSYSGMTAKQIVTQTAKNLGEYLDKKVAEGYKKPIFVVAHLPLHYSMRTVRDGDGMYANLLFEKLDAAGKNGLNIIYMYGHNHSHGWDDYLGGSRVYLAKGDDIIISNGNGGCTTEKLNFTYLNAGYTGYYSYNGKDTIASAMGSTAPLTMTLFQISDTQVIVSRYGRNGKEALKNAGQSKVDYYTPAQEAANGCPVNSLTYESSQTITLGEVHEVPAITIDGKAVSEYAVDVAKVKTLAIGTKNFDGYTVTFTSSDSEVAKINTDGTETTVSFPGKTGTAKITATGTSSERAAGDTLNATLTLTVSNSASTERTYTRVTSADQLESGKQYLIIYNADTDYFMLPEVVTKSGSSGSRTGFKTASTTVAGPDTITGTGYIDYEWTLTQNGNGWLMGKDSKYAKLTSTYNTGITATLEDAGDAFTIGGSADNFTFYNGSYYLNYNGSRDLINGYDSNPAAFYIYKLTAEGGSTEPTEPTEPTEETIYLYVGQKTTRDIKGEYHTEYESNDNPTAVTAEVIGTPASTKPERTVTTAEEASVTVRNLISSDRNSWRATNYYYKVAENDYRPLYAKRSSQWSNGWVYTYTWGYGTSSSNVTLIGTQTTRDTSTAPDIKVYNNLKTTTVPGESVPASTTVTFTANAVGTAVIKVGEHTFTVIVREKAAQNDYPEYPNEGSVRVDKAAQGIDFQNTGVAKVELSTSGVPMKKGVDVILMLDTSGSMDDTVTGSGNKSRIEILRESVANMLKEFNTPDATTGEIPDIRIAIADFNGYETTDSNNPLYLSSNSTITGGTISDGAGDSAEVYTGTKNYTAGAFVPASTYDTTTKRNALVNNIIAHSGTNYDAAFYYSYQLGSAISAKNAEDGDERDLYVVFMSDGAPFQYNFISGRSTQTGWNKWLQGTENNAANYTYFYNENGNRNWWAEAIKGNAGEKYTVIDKTSTDNYGGNRYMTQVAGLGAKMYSIGFCLAVDQQITVASMENVLQKIATDSSYYFKANSADELNNAFGQIAANIKKAGYNASFVDKMGEAYNIQLASFEVNGTNVYPEITVSTYEIWKRSDFEVGEVPIDKVGTRKSDVPTVQERVTFNSDGTEAYSNQIGGGSTNILSNNKINAKLFTYDLTTEEFNWNVGDITENEQVLSYYVYLDGSLEGKRAAGSYPTNESAILYYKNWLDHDARKETVSPVMPWGGANVSYAFYLVDAQGKPIVNQSTGATGSFANAVKVTQPVVYSEVYLYGQTDVSATIVAKDALPAGYTLYDEAADYKVSIKAGSNGSWLITKGADAVTTYVAQYDVKDSSAVTNEVNSDNVNGGQNDYTHTVVWFAVKYIISTIPDAVVIDFGLPVDISVLANDILGENAKLAGVGEAALASSASTGTLATGFANEYVGLFGTASLNGNKVRYTPSNMQMDAAEKFAYAAQAGTESDNNYYYSTVTVIPAANVYYEDSFITFNNNASEWTVVGETKDGITQQEDRPGKFSLAAYDANNVYGFDKAYKECSEFSLGSARKVTVSKETNANAPTAKFTFKGTGFDLISLTSNRTGTILVDVVGRDNGVVKHWIVDTYYGYNRTIDSTNPYIKYTWTVGNDEQWHVKKEEVSSIPEGAVTGGKPEKSGDVTYEHNYKWEVVTTVGEMDNALYQIPVIRGQGLPYGEYDVTVTPKYSAARDPANRGYYDFYLDAVRIYDPAGTNPVGEIGDAYKADGEGWPDIMELRENIINANTLSVDETKANGIVFVDGNAEGNLEEYNNFGPNNEVYLAKGQAIAFKLSVEDASNIDTIQIAAKAPTGSGVIAQVNSGTPTPINTATEMYYTITHRVMWDKNNKNISEPIVIANIGDGVLSFTNIKITYKNAPASKAEPVVDNQLLEEAPAMLMSMLGIEAPAKEKVFEPETFTVKLSSTRNVFVRENVRVTVTTSDDVDYITVGDKKITRYTEERTWGGFRKGLVKTGKRVWSCYVNFTDAGEQVISVVAYDENGLASEAVENTVNVKSRKYWYGKTSEWHI